MYLEDEYDKPLLKEAIRIPCRIEFPQTNVRYSFLADDYELKALVQALCSCGIEIKVLRPEARYGLKLLKDTVLEAMSDSMRLSYDQLGDDYQSHLDKLLSTDGLSDFGNGKYYPLSLVEEAESSETVDYYDNERVYWQMRDDESNDW